MQHRRAASIGAAAALVAVIAALTSVTGNDPQAAQSTAGQWQQLPDPPLTARRGSTTAWTGTEALFLGGVTGALCPPNADCLQPDQTARDGAAYNPKTGSWRPVSPAPVDLPGFGQAPVVGDQAFLLVDGMLLAYDASEDSWSGRLGPPGPVDGWTLQQGDDSVIALRSQQKNQYFADQQYDPKVGRWQALPRDPLVPSVSRDITTTPHGLLLTGQPEVDQPGSQLATSLTRAALLVDGAWQRLPDSDQLGGDFTWAGSRAVAPQLGGANGGQVNGYGRTVPFGGTLELPQGRWGRLPNPPDELSGEYPLYAIDGGRIVTQGWLYDDRQQSWTRLPRPDGAPEQPGSSVWAGDQLVVLGGYTPDEQYSDRGLSRSAYAYSADQ